MCWGDDRNFSSLQYRTATACLLVMPNKHSSNTKGLVFYPTTISSQDC